MPPLALIVALALNAASPASADIKTALVARVVAADILQVQYGDRPAELVALYGVVAPATTEVYGKLAKGFVEALVDGQAVGVQTVLERDGVTYVVVYPATESFTLNELVLREGFAKWDRLSAPENRSYERLEQAAKEAGLGLWSGRDPRLEGPWVFNLWRDGAEATLTLNPDGTKTLVGRGSGQQKKIPGFEAAVLARREREIQAMIAERERQYAAWREEQRRQQERAARQTPQQPVYRRPSNQIIIQRQILQDLRGNVLFTTPYYIVR